jgi:hypothetical protein
VFRKNPEERLQRFLLMQKYLAVIFTRKMFAAGSTLHLETEWLGVVLKGKRIRWVVGEIRLINQRRKKRMQSGGIVVSREVHASSMASIQRLRKKNNRKEVRNQ